MGLRPHGKQLPSPANPEQEVCFKITIPDALQYRAAILGQISFLSLWFAWEHVNDGVIPEDNQTAARLWAQAMGTFVFEECMAICEEVAACFAEDAEFRASVINSLKSDPLFRTAVQEISRLGQPLGPEITTPIVTECDMDKAWSGVQAMIEVIDRANEDFLQFIEAYSNEIEKGAALIANIPVFGPVLSSITLGFVNSFIEDATENYSGAVTIGLLEEYSCDLFCLMGEDETCSLTFEQIYNYFKDRIAGEFDIDSAFGTVIEFIASGTYSGTAIVDFMFMVAIQTIRSADSFLGFDFATLQASIDMGMLSPSSSWETICEGCPPPSADRTPVVESLWDPGNVVGTLSGPDEDGVWTVTSGTRASDEAFVLRDIDGRSFILTDIVYSATPDCQVWLLDGTVLHLACTLGDQYTGQTIDEFWSTWTSGSHRTMQFKMIAP